MGRSLERIVVIDDDPDYLMFVTTLLARGAYSHVGFTRAQEALDYMRANPVALVITDLFMPDMDGFEALKVIAQDFPSIHVITMSGQQAMGKDFYLDCAKHLGAIASLKKPFEPEALRALVAEALRR